MKKKFLFFIFLVSTLVIFIFNGCKAVPIYPKDNSYADISWNKSSIKRYFNKELWTKTELHNRLPVSIKTILLKRGLIPWGRFDSTKKYRGARYTNSKLFSPILITYIKMGIAICRGTVLTYEDEKSTRITADFCIDTDIRNLNPKKQAEAIFDSNTGELVLFKIRISKYEWKTFYDSKNRIGIKIKI